MTLSAGGDRVPTAVGDMATGGSATRHSVHETTVPGTGMTPEPDAVPNAYPMSLATAGAWPVTASWTYIDGMEGLNAHLDSWLLSVLDTRAGPAGGRYRPDMALNTVPVPGPRPGTTLTARPVQAAGTTLVFRETRIDTAPDGIGAAASRTVYADTVTGEVHNPAELLRPASIPGIEATLHDTRDQPRIAETDTGRAGAGIQDMLLDTEGALEITLASAGAGTSPGAGVRVSIDPHTVEAALSDYGRSVLSQLRAHTPVTVPQPSGPGLRHINCDILPCAALTYDDGPDPKTTPQLLGILKDKNVQATFFMQGINAAANPGLARQVTDAGHIPGNHTFSHPHLGRLAAAGIKSEIDRAGAAILAATGTTPASMRPPYGDATPAVQSAVGLPLILWSVDSLDWQNRNPAVFVPKILNEIKPGAVVLMHDVHATTIAGQAGLISALQAQGYHLVTVPQLFQGTPLTAGQIYRSRPERK